MHNFRNTQYVGQIGIGAPGELYSVIFDTGSANMWINSAECHDRGCVAHKQYDSAKSKTYKKIGFDLDVQFGTGSLSGEFGSDTVYINGIEVKNQDFSQIKKEVGAVFAEAKFEGIVGLAYPEMAAYKLPPLFDSIMGQKLLGRNMFSFYYDRNDGGENSQLTIGGVDPTLYTGEVKYYPVVDEYYWTIEAEQVLLGNNDTGLCSKENKCKLIADTGTSLLTGPYDGLQKILSNILILSLLYSSLDQINVREKCSNMAELPSITYTIS